MKHEFNYNIAFSRNIGWLTPKEQKMLRNKRVAIAGMGGVGGVHLLTLARLGVGNFNIADFDKFELHNMNRQVGAGLSTVGREKTVVMRDWVKDINPTCDVRGFQGGLHSENLEDFFKDVDVFIDGLDFFVLGFREKVYKFLENKGIPVVIAAPIGMGASIVNILPGSMKFEDYFGFSQAKGENEKALLFALGLAPGMKHTKYLVLPEAVDFKNKKVSSTPMGVQMASSLAGTEALKILLKRGEVYAAPFSIQYDGYLNRSYKSWMPWGWKNPLQRLKAYYLRKIVLADGSEQKLLEA